MDAVRKLKEIKTTSKDGTNIIVPFLDIFSSFVAGSELRYAEQRNELLGIINTKDKKISELNETIAIQKKHIEKVEEALDEQCQYTRRESLVFSGNLVPVVKDGEDCINEVTQLIQQTLEDDLQVTPADISIAHRLGKKPNAPTLDRRSIIVRFCRRKTKYSVLNAVRTIKPPNLYINESLTPTRMKITRALRNAKAQFPRTVAGYRTSDGSITALIKSPNGNGSGSGISRLKMDSMAKLEKFFQDNFRKSVEHFLQPRERSGSGTAPQED